MPHKHKRQRVNNENDFDLPPSSKAKPLPSFQAAKSKVKAQKKTTKRPVESKPLKTNEYGIDDTPRAFARIMQSQQRKRPLGSLDEGEGSRKGKRSKSTRNDVEKKQVPDSEAAKVPHILPGERLADFSARVNQAMPIAGLARTGKAKIEGVRERQTRTEKRLHKLYAEWRKEDAQIKEREEEKAEEAEEAEEERTAEFGGQDLRLPDGKRARRKRELGEVGIMDEDPWAVLKARREMPKGLHDVVQAPPELKVVPKEKFNVRNGAKVNVANVPNTAGSLKKREDLSEARREVIARYRAMMKT